MTQRAKHFFKKSDLPPGTKVYDDKMEWSSWKARGDPVMHIDLGKMADVMLLAPLTANTLAKVALVSTYSITRTIITNIFPYGRYSYRQGLARGASRHSRQS